MKVKTRLPQSIEEDDSEIWVKNSYILSKKELYLLFHTWNCVCLDGTCSVHQKYDVPNDKTVKNFGPSCSAAQLSMNMPVGYHLCS